MKCGIKRKEVRGEKSHLPNCHAPYGKQYGTPKQPQGQGYILLILPPVSEGTREGHLTLVNLYFLSYKLLRIEVSQGLMRSWKRKQQNKTKKTQKPTLQKEIRSDPYFISHLPNSLKRNHIQSSHCSWTMMNEEEAPWSQ